MAEISQFAERGAGMITPAILKGVHKKLPYLKLKFTEINDPAYPHLIDQLEFLAGVVEDFAEGVEENMPYLTAAAAAFALIYAHRQVDMIPEQLPESSHADDSAVVRAVLVGHQKVFSGYATRHKMKWESISLEP